MTQNQYTFAIRKVPTHEPLNGLRISRAKDARYLGLRLDRRLNWKKRILTRAETTWISSGKNVPATLDSKSQ